MRPDLSFFDQSCAAMCSSKGLFAGWIASQQQQTSALFFGMGWHYNTFFQLLNLLPSRTAGKEETCLQLLWQLVAQDLGW